MIVAHPDDETLWAGGCVLEHPAFAWTIGTLSRASDPDRAPKFHRAVERLHAVGRMADLDDGPDQAPLDPDVVAHTVLGLLPAGRLRLLLTHSPDGEYTRHRRHEEVARAVCALWADGRVAADELWLFAYTDAGRRQLPRAIADAHRKLPLPDRLWREKRALLTAVYGFAPDSFEARTTPRLEAFWCFTAPAALRQWLATRGPAA